MEPREFWGWFKEQSEALKAEAPETRAGTISDKLVELGTSIAVEVSGDVEGEPSEVIFTAGGNVELFDEVYALVEVAPALDGWAFIPLRPARGFEFTLDLEGDATLSADKLSFEPLESPQMPGALGLRIFVDDVLSAREDLEEVLLFLIETGLGEERMAQIVHVEAVPLAEAQEPVPLPVLPAFMDTRLKRLAEESSG
ncbi:MAG: hypothetical protein M3Y59_03290 [Myxococcota bacterium]|nr:hypothetical protein [Myxococcota bacterium]